MNKNQLKIKKEKFKFFKNIKKNQGISRAKEEFFKITDIPVYIQKDLTRMSIYGNNNVFIEQYESVSDYFSHYIKIVCKNMYVIIEGKDLSIKEISNTDLIINGMIDSISYKKVGERV